MKIHHLLLPVLLGGLAAACTGDGTATGDTLSAGDTLSDAGSEAWACAPGDDGLELSDGYCAVVVHEGVGPARHATLTPAGDLFVALREPSGGGAVVALRDTTGDGRADTEVRFGEIGGSGIVWHDGSLYFAPNDRVLRWPLPSGELRPTGAADTLVSGLPTGGHGAKSMAFLDDGALLVNIGSASNACQEEHRTEGSPGQDPCPELDHRAGVWRFEVTTTNQDPDDGARWATGLRNAYALAVHPETGQPFAAVHGRDQLHSLWPGHYTQEESAEKPSEEFVAIDEGDDFGWPYCYHDPATGEKVLAPEYGGDGTEVGRCADKDAPLVAFPAHWAPNDLAFVPGEAAYIAFHGSWNRAPLPQEGYKVSRIPFEGGMPAGEPEVFAAGFPEGSVSPEDAAHRPTGLAVTDEGHLIVVDGQVGRIWRIVPEGSRP